MPMLGDRALRNEAEIVHPAFHCQRKGLDQPMLGVVMRDVFCEDGNHVAFLDCARDEEKGCGFHHVSWRRKAVTAAEFEATCKRLELMRGVREFL